MASFFKNLTRKEDPTIYQNKEVRMIMQRQGLHVQRLQRQAM
jgi:hypothetical protein